MFCCLLKNGRDDWIGYSADQNFGLLRLTPFHFRLPRGHLKPLFARRLLRNLFFCFYTVDQQVNLPQGIKNKKMSFDIFLLHLVLSG